MPFQRVPDGVMISIIATMADQVIENTFYGTMAGYAIGDIEALAAAVDTWAGTTWLTNMPNNYAYARTEVRGLNAAIDLIATNSTHTGNGVIGSDCAANNVALSVKRSSGFTGRAARGRVFVPVADGAIVTNTSAVSPAFSAAILSALDALDGVIGDAGFLPVIVHRVSAGVPLAEAVVFTLIEWVVVDTVIDSMRRRLPKRGV